MPPLITHSELLTRAVKWIDESHREKPEKKLADLIDEACMRFNLSPVDNESLIRLFTRDNSRQTQD